MITNNLAAPDIVGLEEIQDNNGATNDSIGGTLSSRWAVLARELRPGPDRPQADLGALTVVPAINPWTDDFSNLIAVLR